MPRDRRRGRRSRSPSAARTSPVSQKPAQSAAPSRPVPTERVAPVAKAPFPVKQSVLANPRLAKDLRNIAIVTVVLVVVLIVLWLVL
jgi:hypothetical protein